MIMNALTQAYRTTCIPRGDDRLDTLIPSEYMGRKLEIIILPQFDESEYNEETLAAMQETLDIMDGKIEAKEYDTMEELYADIDAEEDD
jgi:hypothetical protein